MVVPDTALAVVAAEASAEPCASPSAQLSFICPRCGQGKVIWRRRRPTFGAAFERRLAKRPAHHVASQRRAPGDALGRPVVGADLTNVNPWIE